MGALGKIQRQKRVLDLSEDRACRVSGCVKHIKAATSDRSHVENFVLGGLFESHIEYKAGVLAGVKGGACNHLKNGSRQPHCSQPILAKHIHT